MTTQDIVFVALWCLSFIVGLIGTTVSIINKDKEPLKFWIGFTFVALTPFGLAISLIAIMFSVMYGIFKGFDYLFNRITKNWK